MNYVQKMVRRNSLALVLAIIHGFLAAPAFAFDPIIFVSWDDIGSPEPGVDFIISTSPPASLDFPDVELVTGSLTWEILSVDTDNPDFLGDIGVISCPHADNFAVAIRSEFMPGTLGARNVKAITLVPSSTSNYANITVGKISGDLMDDLTVEANSFGFGGEVDDLFIGGSVTADMTIHKLNLMGVQGEVFGNIAIDEFETMGLLTIVTHSGSLNIGNAAGVVRIFLPLSGSVDVAEAEGEFSVYLAGGVSQTGEATFGDFAVSPSSVIAIGGGSHELAGAIQFLSGIPSDLTVEVNAELTSTGVIDLNDMGVAGLLQLQRGGDGTIVNGGAVTGTVELGSTAPLTFSGTATFEKVEFGGQIVTDLLAPPALLDGQVTILGVMNGNLCADNLHAFEALPSNITIGCGIGTLGTICGFEHICPFVEIVAADPPDGTRDARQPHPVGDNSLGARQGIGSPNTYTGGPEPIILTLDSATEGVINHDCWTLCESGIEDTEGDPLDPNQVVCVTDTGNGDYEILLERPISAGHWTTITHEGDGSYVTYSSLPADANDSGTSMANDITEHINCCLNQVCTPAHGDYTCDTDHSGLASFPDVLRLIDLLNGAGSFVVWNATTISSNDCPGGGESAMMGPGSGNSLTTEAENVNYIDDLVGLLQRLENNDRMDQAGLIELVIALTDYAGNILSRDERNDLADRLSDASLTFASDIVADMIPDMVAALRDTR